MTLFYLENLSLPIRSHSEALGEGVKTQGILFGETTQPVRVDMGPLAEKEICRSRGERMRLVSCYAAAHATFCLNVL